ncbi:hypothetical protein NB311A_15692 [Nitrobacter sp. Nb-311A]|nr:hypothetical protein NB311A_15692 [Nitrobacter sp. Nb-311A]
MILNRFDPKSSRHQGEHLLRLVIKVSIFKTRLPRHAGKGKS